MLTASLLRRSCSFFRAISLSFSKGVMKASMLDFGISTSLRVSNVALEQRFSVRPASFLRGSRFSCVFHGSRELKGKEALMSGDQTFKFIPISVRLNASSWGWCREYWIGLLNTKFFQETPSCHFLPLVSLVLLHVPFLGQPYETAGRRLSTTSPKPAPPTDSPVLPKNQRFLEQFPTKRFPGFISELSRIRVSPTRGTGGNEDWAGAPVQPAGSNHLSTPVVHPRGASGLYRTPVNSTGDIKADRLAGCCSFESRRHHF